jgi:hypothetical protein
VQSRKSKLTIIIGLHFLNDRFLIAHKFHVGPNDAVAGLIDNPAADTAVRLLLGLLIGP